MAEKINHEIIAVITAAVQATCGGHKVIAVKIKSNDNWTLAAKLNK